MSFYETLDHDFKEALRARDEVRLPVLRMLKTAIRNKEVETRRKLEDGEIMVLIKSQVKQRRDSISQFEKGGRDDLVQREKAELDVIQTYLPAQLSQEEIEKALADLIKELGASSMKDMGRVMKEFMSRFGGQVDGKVASETVKKGLSQA